MIMKYPIALVGTGEFIDPETPVSIEKIEGNIVLVKPVKD